MAASSEVSQDVEISISRRDEADRVVSKYTGWAAGSGAIPFPLWDIAAIASLEVAMIKRLLEIYDAPFSESRARSVIMVLIGSVAPPMLAGVTAMTFMKVVPGVGHLLASVSLPMLAAASCYAVGKVFVNHLEGGGDLSNFDPVAAKKKFREAFEDGKARFKKAKDFKAGDPQPTS